MIEETLVHCPYCGEAVDIVLDPSAGNQAFIEDCQVCCRPIELCVEFDANGELVGLQARRDDE